jgi:PLP dependent protein
MHSSLNQIILLNNRIKELTDKRQLKTSPKIIVVSKTFPLDKVKPLIDSGHTHFGENKIQEAEIKWSEITKINKNIKLHMIGKLQSNKAKNAVKLFDYIHSLDNEKLALKLNQQQNNLGKKCKYFIQVNLADEQNKSGISSNLLNNFYKYCTNDLSLNVIGLMCLPPINLDPKKYFIILKKNAELLNLSELSMGMSSDYEEAVQNGSTFLRLGTAVLGNRSIT